MLAQFQTPHQSPVTAETQTPVPAATDSLRSADSTHQETRATESFASPNTPPTILPIHPCSPAAHSRLASAELTSCALLPTPCVSKPRPSASRCAPEVGSPHSRTQPAAPTPRSSSADTIPCRSAAADFEFPLHPARSPHAVSE